MLIEPKSSDVAGLVELVERGVRAGDVRRVVLVVVQLEHLGGVVRLEGGEVVGQLGEGVGGHQRSPSRGSVDRYPRRESQSGLIPGRSR